MSTGLVEKNEVILEAGPLFVVPTAEPPRTRCWWCRGHGVLPNEGGGEMCPWCHGHGHVLTWTEDETEHAAGCLGSEKP